MSTPKLTEAQRRSLSSVDTSGSADGWVEWLLAWNLIEQWRSPEGNVSVYALTDAGRAALRGES